MSNYLVINIKPEERITDPDALALFPYRDGQYEESGMSDEPDQVFVDLAGESDTTAAQEQFLNTNPRVIGYTIETR